VCDLEVMGAPSILRSPCHGNGEGKNKNLFVFLTHMARLRELTALFVLAGVVVLLADNNFVDGQPAQWPDGKPPLPSGKPPDDDQWVPYTWACACATQIEMRMRRMKLHKYDSANCSPIFGN
jgi:hypothetical protein